MGPNMSIIYRTIDDGTVQTQQSDGSWTTPWPAQAEIDFFESKVAIWLSLVEETAARHGLPSSVVPYILAIMHGEGAKPNYVSFDNGVGLMQITASSLKKKPGGGYYTADELKDPALNIDIAVDKMIAPEFELMGFDLPQIASGYNGGFSPAKGANRSSEGPWGWLEYKIPKTGAHPYISKVVRVSNYAIQSLSGRGQSPNNPPEPEPESDSGSGGGTALVIGALALATFFLVRYSRS